MRLCKFCHLALCLKMGAFETFSLHDEEFIGKRSWLVEGTSDGRQFWDVRARERKAACIALGLGNLKLNAIA